MLLEAKTKAGNMVLELAETVAKDGLTGIGIKQLAGRILSGRYPCMVGSVFQARGPSLWVELVLMDSQGQVRSCGCYSIAEGV